MSPRTALLVVAAATAGLAAATTVTPPTLLPRLPRGSPNLSPTWPITYAANESAYLYYCSWTRPLDPAPIANWSIVSLDWSNQKWGPAGWAKSKPMDCEQRLFADATNFVAKSTRPSTTRAMVYRNTCKALPWFEVVRMKLEDPAYAPWFLNFASNATVNGSYYSPPSDAHDDPPLCSNFYHDSVCPAYESGACQGPGYPTGDGVCAPPGCDVGSE